MCSASDAITLSRTDLMFPKPAKGTARKERRASRRSREQAFRDAVWQTYSVEVSGYQVARCARCSRMVVRGVNGEVDHIKPRSTHPERAFDPANGRILCHADNLYMKRNPLEREV